jgi:pimeloyl-ACP methyl ester carboxylesterase
MVAQVQGPVLLVGHSYGGAVITEAGNAANVMGLVYIAAFAPDAGESPGGLTQKAPAGGGAEPEPTATATCGSRPTSSTRASARTCRLTMYW